MYCWLNRFDSDVDMVRCELIWYDVCRFIVRYDVRYCWLVGLLNVELLYSSDVFVFSVCSFNLFYVWLMFRLIVWCGWWLS